MVKGVNRARRTCGKSPEKIFWERFSGRHSRKRPGGFFTHNNSSDDLLNRKHCSYPSSDICPGDRAKRPVRLVRRSDVSPARCVAFYTYIFHTGIRDHAPYRYLGCWHLCKTMRDLASFRWPSPDLGTLGDEIIIKAVSSCSEKSSKDLAAFAKSALGPNAVDPSASHDTPAEFRRRTPGKTRC
jgi:hypothetical protein